MTHHGRIGGCITAIRFIGEAIHVLRIRQSGSLYVQPLILNVDHQNAIRLMTTFVAKSDAGIAIAGGHAAVVTRLRRVRHQRLVQVQMATISLLLALVVLLHGGHYRIAVGRKVAAACGSGVAAALDAEFASQRRVLGVRGRQHNEDVAAVGGLLAQRRRHDAEIAFVLLVAGAAKCDSTTGIHGDGGATFIL